MQYHQLKRSIDNETLFFTRVDRSLCQDHERLCLGLGTLLSKIN